MTNNDEALTPAELLDTAERLFSIGDTNMYRASILEAISALEAIVHTKAFPALQKQVGDELAKWLEEKTKMDFETRIGLFIPIATGITINKKDRLWNDYKKAKEIRNKVTHTGRKVSQAQARFVINTVYEWVAYLKEAQEAQTTRTGQDKTDFETLGRFIQASARLERVIYSAMIKNNPRQELSSRRVYPVEELFRLELVDDSRFRELIELRSIRNRVYSTRLDFGRF